MRTITFGREAVLQNQGVDYQWQVTRDIRVKGVNASVALGFPLGAPSGFAQAFVNLWITEAGQAPQFSADANRYYAGPPPAAWGGDFANLTVTTPPGSNPGSNPGANSPVMFGDGMPVPGGLFSVILKTWAPAAANLPVMWPGLDIFVPAASFFVLHMDAGPAQCDVETGITIAYEPL